MLHAIDEQGNTTHICPHCNAKNEHHILQLEWGMDADAVALPPCKDCKTQTFVKTRFSQQDLKEPSIQRDEFGTIINVVIHGAPNLWQIISHDERREDGSLISIIDTVVRHPAIAKHQELSRQLYAMQKFPLVETSAHTDEGMIHWKCPACGQEKQASISHPEVAHVPSQATIALPACVCGVRVAVKVDQPEPPPINLLVAGPDGQPAVLSGVPIEQVTRAKNHQKFLLQLRNIGKLPPGKEGES
jgi:transcription elongation factor Elf1